jgi:two-component system, chemotaxis family, sensor kinase Cph1
MLDIDHFKQVNDVYGHAQGDRVLKTLVKELPSLLYPTNLFARLGGEEFGVLLEGFNQTQAIALAEALRARCAALDFGIGRQVTVSIGVAQWATAESATALMQRCDAALYRAKTAGRNAVNAASSTT